MIAIILTNETHQNSIWFLEKVLLHIDAFEWLNLPSNLTRQDLIVS